jgi:hypothetical protein
MRPEIVATAPAGLSDPGWATSANAALPWDDFDTRDYLDHNYRTLRDDDQQIIRLVGEFFESAGVTAGRGIDVGTGANLYPVLAMLPFCDEITLWERSVSNVAWLRGEVVGYSPLWDPFWRQLSDRHPYSRITEPRPTLASRVRVRREDIFGLSADHWDIGTMFFVAESLSGIRDEFELALRRFVCALRPGAPFAAAFMENSCGYNVGGRWFPSVAVSADDISDSLAWLAHNVVIHRIGTAIPLRDGYDGMVLTVGYAGH